MKRSSEQTVEYDWRTPYEALRVPVRYEMTVRDGRAIRAQLESITGRGRTVSAIALGIALPLSGNLDLFFVLLLKQL